ncbi:hypothetical protein [uncultured Vibrio sp.]|uniref:hypothetical protein n=1 Tax=uncultured Vibrio sp. TaxID=114054 RepID=UPI0025CD86B8|nr:hypothetical protein [uncultured Vibrio sp.]
MKFFLLIISVVLTSFAHANDMNVIYVSDGFTMNGKPASTIYYCMPNETDCIEFSVNSTSLSQLIGGETVSNKMRNNVDIDATANMNGNEFVISSKHPSIFAVRVQNHSAQDRTIEFFYNLHIVSPKVGKQVSMKEKYFYVSGDQYDTLMGLEK